MSVFRASALHESSVDLDSLGRTDCIQSEPCALSPRSPERFLLHLPGWPLATICVCRRIRHSDSCGQPFKECKSPLQKSLSRLRTLLNF